MRNLPPSLFCLTVLVALLMCVACQQEREHTAPAIYDRDSVAMMTSYGVNTLISDSGVIKYRIVAERWEVNEVKHPSRWTFDKGVLLTQFDQTFHIQAYIQCDTAYYFDKIRMWELRGRVKILTKQGTTFTSEELFWDEQKHEIWSHRYSHLKTPERELQGNYFKSDERMTHYVVTNTKGSFERADMGFDKPNPKDSLRTAQRNDSLKNSQAAKPQTAAPVKHQTANMPSPQLRKNNQQMVKKPMKEGDRQRLGPDFKNRRPHPDKRKFAPKNKLKVE